MRWKENWVGRWWADSIIMQRPNAPVPLPTIGLVMGSTHTHTRRNQGVRECE